MLSAHQKLGIGMDKGKRPNYTAPFSLRQATIQDDTFDRSFPRESGRVLSCNQTFRYPTCDRRLASPLTSNLSS